MPLAVIDSFLFSGNIPSVAQVASGIYAVAFCRGVTPDGHLTTVSIDNTGAIGLIDTWEFETTQGRAPSIIHVSGDIYAIAYEDVNGSGQVITVEIDSAGNITVPRLDILEFFTYVIGIKDYMTPHIIHVSGDIFVIAYSQPDQDGWLATINIDNLGNITAVDTHEFDNNYARAPFILKISGTTYAIAYMGPTSRGDLQTLTIADNGAIAPAPILDTLTFDALHGDTPCLVHVSGDIYAVAYTGQNGDGWLATVDIDAAGNIAAVGTFEFDGLDGNEPYIIQIISGVYAIAYRGVGNDGFIITIAIATDGTIGAIDKTLKYDTSTGYFPYMFEITTGIVAIAYGSAGRIRTIGGFDILPTVQTNPATEVLA